MHRSELLTFIPLLTALVVLTTAVVNLLGAIGKGGPDGRGARNVWVIPVSALTALAAVLLAGYLVLFEFDSQLELRDPVAFHGGGPYHYARVYPDRPSLFSQSPLSDEINAARCTFDIIGPNATSITSERHRGAVEAAIARGVRFRVITLDPDSDAMRLLASAQGRHLPTEVARDREHQKQFGEMAALESNSGDGLEH